MSITMSYFRHPVVIVALFASLAVTSNNIASSDDRIAIATTQIHCESLSDDADENADGSVSWIPTHRVRPAEYHKLTTRYSPDGTAVTLNYFLYEPRQTPRGLLILITGGALNANLNSTDGKTLNRSGGNFLIRSAHHFAARGYRVIGMNRPDDFRSYGTIDTEPMLYDSYRNSMAHAVDIAMVLRAHRVTNAPVILIGSSRGAISAFAQQTLANVIVLASPVTSGNGTPLVPSAHNLKMASRPSVILLHHDDACSRSTPQHAEAFAQALHANGQRVSLLEISGGIRDSASDDPCAALDHHGYAGIETCTVNTTMDAVEQQVARTSRHNHLPVATDLSMAVTDRTVRFRLHSLNAATDDILRYTLPARQSVLGGIISLDSRSGKISYQRPENIRAVTDRIAYSISDGEGGVSVGIISLELN